MFIPLRPWLLRLHLGLALLAGLFFVILGVTGSVLAFSDNLDRSLHAGLYAVSAGQRDLPLSELLASVHREFPADDVVSVSMPVSAHEPWQFALPSGIAFVDPHDGRILGLRARGMTFVGYVRQLHVSLASGGIGRTTVRWTDLAALLLLLSGMQLWLPLRRFGLRRRSLPRRFWLDLHNSLGVLSFLFLLLAVTTGALLSFEGSLSRLLGRFAHPHRERAAVALQPAKTGPYLSPDRALALAEEADPGYTATCLQMPAYGGSYRVTLERAHTFGAAEEDEVTLDPRSGFILGDDSSRDRPLAWHLLTGAAALHTGAWLGAPGRIVMAAASFLVVLQALSGAMMLWHRRRNFFRGVLR